MDLMGRSAKTVYLIVNLNLSFFYSFPLASFSLFSSLELGRFPSRSMRG